MADGTPWDAARLELEERASGVLAREYLGGVSVINCVAHAERSLLERPDDCRLCAADVRNALSRAFSVNGWLNQWKDDASKALSALLVSALEARATELDAYAASLPEGVSTEACAEATNLRREAARLRA